MEGASSQIGLLSPNRAEGGSSQSHGMEASKQLTVLYYNARSILPKLDELRTSVLFQKPDIICIVETWLSEDVTDNELLLPDYQVYRLDHNRHGGGIVLYVHDSLSCKKGDPHNLEFLALSVTSISALVTNKFCIYLFIVIRLQLFLFLIIFVRHYRWLIQLSSLPFF